MSWSLLLVYQLEFFFRVAIPFSPSALGVMMNWKILIAANKEPGSRQGIQATIYIIFFLHGTHGQLSRLHRPWLGQGPDPVLHSLYVSPTSVYLLKNS
jgi:hypothetical protein